MNKLLAPLVVLFILAAPAALAQNATPFTSDLLAPTKIIFTQRGNLIVAEQGNGPNTGRISIIDRNTGAARTLISGLPSGINTLGGEPAPSGPDGVALDANFLYVTIGGGDAAIPGPLPGTEIPSDNPSSPILSSLLSFETRLPFDDLQGPFTLSRSQHDDLKAARSVSFGSGFNTLTVRLVADFPDLRFEPRQDFPGNFRASNPFGVAVRSGTAYVVNAGWNLIHAVDINSGTFHTLATFPPVNNPTPVGPPVIDAVPNSIQFYQGQLLVTTLTGFPFPPGAARAAYVDPDTGAIVTVQQGLTSAIDIEPVSTEVGSQTYLVLEFSTNMLGGAPGRLTMVTGATGKIVAAPLISPTSMAADLVRGEVFVTQIFTGQVIRVATAGIVPVAFPPSVIPIVASSAGVGGSQFETTVQLTNPYEFAISGVLVLRTTGGTGDPSLPYSLAPHATLAFNNIMQSFGRTGIGSIDILPAIGPPPVAAVRIHEVGTGNGFYQQPVPAENVLVSGQRVAFLAPTSVTEFRMNLGIRTFSAGTNIKVTVFHADGSQGSGTTHTLVPNSVVQMPAAQFVGDDLRANDSILVEIVNGAAIVYGSVINNQTQASSIQIPSPVQ